MSDQHGGQDPVVCPGCESNGQMDHNYFAGVCMAELVVYDDCTCTDFDSWMHLNRCSQI